MVDENIIKLEIKRFLRHWHTNITNFITKLPNIIIVVKLYTWLKYCHHYLFHHSTSTIPCLRIAITAYVTCSYSLIQFYYICSTISRLRDILFSHADDVVGLEKEKLQLVTVSDAQWVWLVLCYFRPWRREIKRFLCIKIWWKLR